ncbi:MAG TPA: hypothetical protein VHA52_11340, partial [Candidatus Babeliaceae bacterium]|nr:hypothetical protein [Candidatus Babeliaceae bacterium]
MKTLIKILSVLLLCCNITYGQSIQSQISNYNTGVNSSITNSNTHSQQITHTIVGNAFTNLSGIVNNIYDSLSARDSFSTIIDLSRYVVNDTSVDQTAIIQSV